MRLVSIQVGKPVGLGVAGVTEGFDKPWTTGYGKRPVRGPVQCGRLNLAGDGQHDKRWHGGPEMAVLAYSADHYARWNAEPGGSGLGPGAFAENLTVEGADEQTVCIGDVWAIGGGSEPVELQVSEPRQPCNNISRFHHRKDLLRQTVDTGRIGWYLRVLREGALEAGMEVRLVRRSQPAWTVARAMEARRRLKKEREAALALAALPELGADWREILLAKLAGKEE